MVRQRDLYDQKKGPVIGQRHILAISSCFGLAILFASRTSLSVALVAMVKPNNVTSDSAHENNGDCPAPSMNTSADIEPNPLLSGEFHWSRELQGLILSSYFWGYLALQVPSGSLAQKYGGKWLMGGGLLSMSVLNFLIPLCARTSPYIMLALLVLMGVVSSVMFPACLAMLGRWAPAQESTSLMTIAMSGSYIGGVTGQLYAGPICASSAIGGWPSVFYVNGTLGLLWFVAWNFLVADSPQDHPRISELEKHYVTTSAGSDQKSVNSAGVPWRQILFSREMAVYIPESFALGWLSYSIITCLPQFLSDVLHVNISSNGVLSALPLLGEFLVANVLTQVSDVMIRRRCLSKIMIRKMFNLIGFWGCAVGFLAVIFVKCDAFSIEVLLVVGYSFFGSIYGGYFAIPLDVSPDFSGTIFGIGNLFTTGAGIIAPIVIGAMTPDHSRAAWIRVFSLSFSVSAAAGFIHLLFGSAKRRYWRKEIGDETPLLTEEKNELTRTDP